MSNPWLYIILSTKLQLCIRILGVQLLTLCVHIVLFVFTTNCILRVSSLFAWFALKLFWLISVYKVSRFIPCQQLNTCYWELWDLVTSSHQMELFISWSESCTHVLQIVFKPEDKVSDSLCTKIAWP